MKALKRLLKSSVHSVGYELLPYRIANADELSLRHLINSKNVNLVLDVGANRGDFVRALRAIGYSGRAVSFEPQSRAHKDLEAAAWGDAAWTIAPRMAIGSKAATATMNIAGNSESSSLLAMADAHRHAAPGSEYVTTETVSVHSLDENGVIDIGRGTRTLLKIDVQGNELDVLQGAERTLAVTEVVFVEVSLVVLYENQPLFRDVWSYLEERGFLLWSIKPMFRDPESFRVLQADATFVREFDNI